MTDPIKHVVLLMLENHSFDQMLGDLKDKTYPNIEGVDRSNPKSNPDKKGNPVIQKPTRETQMIHDPWHETRDVLKQLGNKNTGFVQDFLANYPQCKDR
jgi:phospholipase C